MRASENERQNGKPFQKLSKKFKNRYRKITNHDLLGEAFEGAFFTHELWNEIDTDADAKGHELSRAWENIQVC